MVVATKLDALVVYRPPKSFHFITNLVAKLFLSVKADDYDADDDVHSRLTWLTPPDR